MVTSRTPEILREVNENLRRLADADDSEPIEFFCECTEDACDAAVQLTAAEFDALTDSDTPWLVAAGHRSPPERVTRWWVV